MSYWECELRPKRKTDYMINSEDFGYSDNEIENWNKEDAEEWGLNALSHNVKSDVEDDVREFIQENFNVVCYKYDHLFK